MNYLQKGEQQKKLQWWPIALLAGEWIFVLTLFILEVSGVELNDQIKTLRVAGYCKALITFVKYMPQVSILLRYCFNHTIDGHLVKSIQVYLNYKRQSTIGWSIENIFLDFTGGVLSLLQQILDTVARGQPFFGTDSFNIVKFLLSIMSIIFDIIFLFQHYVLYKDARKKAQLTKGLDKEQVNFQIIIFQIFDEDQQMINKSNNKTASHIYEE